MRNIATNRRMVFAALLLFLTVGLHANEKDKVVWKPIPNVILQVDSRAPKEWNVFQAGKKFDPLLVQIGFRFLVVYVHNMEAYEIKPELLEHKGDTLLWREADKPAKPMATSDWSTKDVGSAFRIMLKLADEGRIVNIELPQMPDVRRGIY